MIISRPIDTKSVSSARVFVPEDSRDASEALPVSKLPDHLGTTYARPIGAYGSHAYVFSRGTDGSLQADIFVKGEPVHVVFHSLDESIAAPHWTPVRLREVSAKITVQQPGAPDEEATLQATQAEGTFSNGRWGVFKTTPHTSETGGAHLPKTVGNLGRALAQYYPEILDAVDGIPSVAQPDDAVLEWNEGARLGLAAGENIAAVTVPHGYAIGGRDAQMETELAPGFENTEELAKYKRDVGADGLNFESQPSSRTFGFNAKVYPSGTVEFTGIALERRETPVTVSPSGELDDHGIPLLDDRSERLIQYAPLIRKAFGVDETP